MNKMTFPENLKYSEEHEWIRIEDNNIAYIGITQHAQSELGEIVYVEVETVGEEIDRGDEFGVVEAVKTTSDLFMPVSGKIIEFNPAISQEGDDNPALVNEAPYGEGWIIKIEMRDVTELDDLMSADAYAEMVG